MHSEPAFHLVLHGRRGAVARWEPGVLLVQTRKERHRIPVAAIEEVEVRGRRGRVLAVVLASGDGVAPAATRLVKCRSAPAVDAFAAALRAELSVRDAAERGQGAGTVSVERLERPKRRARPRLRTVAVALYLLVLAWLVAVLVGEPAHRGSFTAVSALVCWILSPGLAALGRLVTPVVWELIEEPWRLRTRGITVTGELVRTYQREGTWFVYAFTDTRGRKRTCRSRDGGPGRVEITYDPERAGLSRVGSSTTGDLVFGGVLFLVLVSPLVVGAVVLGVLGVVQLADLVGTVGPRLPIG
ncbi:hypothetical protein [Streptomyces amakusaensis]|uniref:Integral membrane protein n=1 Tax=Streptomyces amakusaensis TaxID=67271 RepID=A0ABW0AQ74_9ACTN